MEKNNKRRTSLSRMWQEFMDATNDQQMVVSRLLERLHKEVVMAGRSKLSAKGSRALFTATASRTHRKNVQPIPMRGGIRL